MTATFGVTNQKGGVGKSTNSINLAGAFAELGHSVLAIDTDPQGYFTNKLGLGEAYKADPPTFYDALNEPTDYHLEDLVVTHPEFDVIPANIDMFRLEQDLIASGWKPRQRLATFFEQLDETAYEVVIVDAPPSLGPINDNVLLACGDILVPVEAEETSILAIDHLLRQVETLEERYSTTITERGIVISKVDYPLDNEEHRMIDWFYDTFDNRCPVHEIRKRAAIKRSISADGSVFGENAEECDMSENYLELARSLEVPTNE
jgi:chromosome partitioning protein